MIGSSIEQRYVTYLPSLIIRHDLPRPMKCYIKFTLGPVINLRSYCNNIGRSMHVHEYMHRCNGSWKYKNIEVVTILLPTKSVQLLKAF